MTGPSSEARAGARAEGMAPALDAAATIGGLLGLGEGVPDGLDRRQRRAARRELRALMRGAKASSREASRALRAARRQDAERTKSIKAQLKERDRELSARTADARRRRDRASDTAGLLGYKLMHADGICEVEDGVFSQTLSLSDISYQSAREDRQRHMFDVMCQVIDYFGSDTMVQFNVVNTPIPSSEVGRRRFFDEEGQPTEAAAQDARAYNRILNDKMREGVSNIRRARYLTYAVAAPSAEAAVPTLARIRSDVANILARIGCVAEVLDGHARLEALHALLDPGTALDFDYDRDVTASSGLSTKDAIAPCSIDFKAGGSDASWYRSGPMCHQVLVMRSFGSECSDRMLSDLADLPIPLNMCWFLQPMDKSKAVNFVKQRLSWIDKEIIEEQQRAARRHYDFTILPAELAWSKEEAAAVLDDLQAKSQRLFTFTGLVHTYAPDKAVLDERVRQVIDTAKTNSVEVQTLDFRQRQAMNSMLPLGHNHVAVSRMFTTAEAAILMPFATQELDQEGGIYAGQNANSNNLVMVNRKALASPVGFICGKTGSGKSFFVKQEVEGTILTSPDDQIILFDRAGEFVPLTEHHGGTHIRFGVDSPVHLNPFDLSTLSHMSAEAQLAFKVDAMLAQAAASAAQSGKGLDEGEQSLISRAVELAFERARGAGGDGAVPLLGDFHAILCDESLCPEPAARRIALRYERFVTGSMSFFNQPSNVDWSQRIVDIDVRELPDSMLVFALIAMCEAARNQMYANFERGVRTWIYIEEIQSLFQYPAVLNYFSRFANEARKFGGIVTGITQSSTAMLESREARDLVLNADYIVLLKQSALDRERWVDFLDLSAQEEGCFDDGADRGCGLLVAGGARVPIRGGFPRGNALYELFSTDPNEAAERAAGKGRGHGA